MASFYQYQLYKFYLVANHYPGSAVNVPAFTVRKGSLPASSPIIAKEKTTD